MNEIAVNFSEFIQVQNSQPVTNSKFVANAFNKRHDNILAKIIELKSEIPEQFHFLNFKEMEIETEIGLGKTCKAKAYELTKACIKL